MKQQIATRILQEQDRVLVLMDGKLIADYPHQAAEQIGLAMVRVARMAANFEKRDELIEDAKILRDAGAPVNVEAALLAGVSGDGSRVGTPELIGSPAPVKEGQHG